MRINQDNIIEDAQKMFDGLQGNSYSKNRVFSYDIGAINYVLATISNHYFDFPQIFNPYHEKLITRSDAKNMWDYTLFVFSYMEEYLKLAENYTALLEENNFTKTKDLNGKTYSSTEIKEILLDFFNEQGADKYKIVKSMFDEERVEIQKLDLDGSRAVCSIMSSDIRPYVIVDSNPNKVRLCNICDLAHEFGHAIEAHLKLNRYNRTQEDRKKLLVEVSSKFYEYEFCKYLQRNRIEYKTANSIINEYHNAIRIFCEKLKFMNSDEIIQDGEKYIHIEDAISIDDEKNIMKAFRKEGEENIYVFGFDFYKPLKYALGGLAALNLSEIKSKDPKEFNELWNYFLSMRTLLNEEDILDLFCITPDEFVECDYIKELIKNDVGTYNKQLKRQL